MSMAEQKNKKLGMLLLFGVIGVVNTAFAEIFLRKSKCYSTKININKNSGLSF